MTPRISAALLAMLLLAGCTSTPTPPPGAAEPASARSSTAATSSSGTSSAPSDTATKKGPPLIGRPTAKQLCTAALPGRTLLGWGDTTVRALRSYRYGPPSNPPVLADAFPGVPDDAAGTWCVTLDDPRATVWWGVVNEVAEHVVTIEGPGEGTPQGEVTTGPAIP